MRCLRYLISPIKFYESPHQMANLQIIQIMKHPQLGESPLAYLALPLALTDIAHQSPASPPSRPATYPKSSEIS
jgi:hypothetical protein